jgi:hypothetical protein
LFQLFLKKHRGWCIIGTGLCDGVASLWPSKEHVPADGTRSLKTVPADVNSLNRKRQPGIPARVERVELQKKSSGGFIVVVKVARVVFYLKRDDSFIA